MEILLSCTKPPICDTVNISGHYSDVTWVSLHLMLMCLMSLGNPVFVQKLVLANDKEVIKTLDYSTPPPPHPLCRISPKMDFNACHGTIMVKGPLQWSHNGHDSVSNPHPRNYLLNLLFRRRSKKTSTLRVTGICAGNSPRTCGFPTQMGSHVENVSIWWRHHDIISEWLKWDNKLKLHCFFIIKVSS